MVNDKRSVFTGSKKNSYKFWLTIMIKWDELQRQFDAKGLKIKKGMIQDATFIQSDPGHARADKTRGDEAKTRRSKDGTWSKKGGKSYYGYKLHTIIDVDFQLIRRIKTTTASVHDSQVDLSMEGEVAYRDKGYFGVNPRGYDATMQRGVRGHSIGIRDVLRNKRINHTRACLLYTSPSPRDRS